MVNVEQARNLISFCLFSYNQEKFIEEAIQGALSQIYSPLEVIISDDCSSDKTFEIIQKVTRDYSGPHKIIINCNEKNLGLAAHVNKVLLELAHGEWFVCAAGDDISLPHRVERTWATIIKNPEAKGAHCAADRVDEGGRSLNIVLPRKIDLKIIERDSMLGAVAAYHRDVIDLYGPMDIHVQNEDMVLSLRALLEGEIVSFDDICVLWRRHSNNISGRINSSVIDQIRFTCCDYQKKRLFSSIQQLCDVLSVEERYQGQVFEIQNLQLRLIKMIRFGWLISRFSSFLFFKTSVPLSVKINPFLWFFFLKVVAKHYFAYFLQSTVSKKIIKNLKNYSKKI